MAAALPVPAAGGVKRERSAGELPQVAVPAPSAGGVASSAGPSTAAAAGDAVSRRSKRARRAPQAGEEDEPPGMEEALQLRLALEKSLVDTTAAREVVLPEAIVLRPTVEEWANPLAYIGSVAERCMPYGIARIVPPKGWRPPCGLDSATRTRQFCTRLQRLHLLGQGVPFPDGRSYVMQEYHAMAKAFKAKYPEFAATAENVAAGGAEQGWSPEEAARRSSAEALAARMERLYWQAVQTGSPQLSVEYGNDQDTDTFGSGFLRRACFTQGTAEQRRVGVGGMGGSTLEATEYAVVGHSKRGQIEQNRLAAGLASTVQPKFGSREYYKTTGWNLNNMPHLPTSLLRLVPEAVGGINVPWLYFGMLFSTFCWHVEDNYLFSINYMHHGEGKLWYGVPGTEAPAFEAVMKRHLHQKFRNQPDLLFHLTTMLSPATLAAEGVRAYRTVQHAGEFIITFPRAYHSGFSLGFNVAEACNFALTQWIPWGRKAVQVYRSAAVPRPAVFCHEKLMLDLGRWALAPQSEFSPSQLTVIAGEVGRVAEEEEEDRAALAADGFGEGTRFFVRNDGDARGECVRCRRACYLSAVLCRTCGAKRMACARHHRSLCACPPGGGGKLLLYWHTVKALQDVQAALLAKAAQGASAGPGLEQTTPPAGPAPPPGAAAGGAAR